PSYYQLYRIYLALNDKEKAEYYKKLLLDKYPDSDFSKIIKNPAYADEVKSASSKIQQYYEVTYDAFLNGQYSEVIKRKTLADSLYPNNSLEAKFDYLKALSIGKLE